MNHIGTGSNKQMKVFTFSEMNSNEKRKGNDGVAIDIVSYRSFYRINYTSKGLSQG